MSASGGTESAEGRGGEDRVAPLLSSGAIQCADCGAVFSGGRWSWAREAGASLGLCPACQRTRDDSPVARVSIRVPDARERRVLVARIEALAAAVRSEHPLERVLDVRATGLGLEVTTTGLRLSDRLVDEFGDRGGVSLEVLA